MKAIIYFRDGKSETFNIKGLMFDDGPWVDIRLAEKILRPPDKHKVLEVDFNKKDIEKIEVFND